MRIHLSLLSIPIVAIAFVSGCANESVPSNAEELKSIKTAPSNNPDVGAVDGANKEFGKGKPPPESAGS